MVFFASRPKNPWQIHVNPSAISRRDGQSLDAMELLPCMFLPVSSKINYVFRYQSSPKIYSSEQKI